MHTMTMREALKIADSASTHTRDELIAAQQRLQSMRTCDSTRTAAAKRALHAALTN